MAGDKEHPIIVIIFGDGAESAMNHRTDDELAGAFEANGYVREDVISSPQKDGKLLYVVGNSHNGTTLANIKEQLTEIRSQNPDRSISIYTFAHGDYSNDGSTINIENSPEPQPSEDFYQIISESLNGNFDMFMNNCKSGSHHNKATDELPDNIFVFTSSKYFELTGGKRSSTFIDALEAGFLGDLPLTAENSADLYVSQISRDADEPITTVTGADKRYSDYEDYFKYVKKCEESFKECTHAELVNVGLPSYITEENFEKIKLDALNANIVRDLDKHNYGKLLVIGKYLHIRDEGHSFNMNETERLYNNLLEQNGFNFEYKATDINADGYTPLHVASETPGDDLVIKLIQDGANVNALGAMSKTPLMSAAASGNMDAVKTLIENGADIYAKDTNGNTMLHYASQNAYDSKEVIEFFAKYIDVNTQNNAGATALIHGMESDGHPENLIELINQGADVHITDGDGKSAAHHLQHYRKNNINFYKKLVNEGVDLNQPDPDGNIPALELIGNKSPEIIGFIIDNSDILITSEDGLNTAHLLLRFLPEKELFEKVLQSEKIEDNEKFLNQKNDDGNTPLLYTYKGSFGDLFKYQDRKELIVSLINQGLDINATNTNDETIVHLVKENYEIDFLVEQGANLNAQNYEGKTPLSGSAEKLKEAEHPEKILKLIENGARTNIADNNGEYAYDAISSTPVSHESNEETKPASIEGQLFPEEEEQEKTYNPKLHLLLKTCCKIDDAIDSPNTAPKEEAILQRLKAQLVDNYETLDETMAKKAELTIEALNLPGLEMITFNNDFMPQLKGLNVTSPEIQKQ